MREIVTDNTGTGEFFLDRGYTGHEHLAMFGIINMNGRVYDPILGRFLNPDNYVQFPGYTQAFNRYSYALNNPFKYTDPDGEMFWMIPVGIGMAFGAYQGYQIGKAMNAEGLAMAGYIAGGAIIGGIAGYVGTAIAATGLPYANTISMMMSSGFSSTGMSMLSGGQTDVTMSFGVASYNFSQNEWRYLGKKGNSFKQNLGYFYGASGVTSDIVAGFNGTSVDLKANWKLTGHNEIENEWYIAGYDRLGNPLHEEILISVGPEDRLLGVPTKNQLEWEMYYAKQSLKFQSVDGSNSFNRSWDKYSNVQLNNLNGKLLSGMTKNLNNGRNLLNIGRLKYGILHGCVNQTSRALLYAGVININAFMPLTAPLLLNAEMLARQMIIDNHSFFINDYN